MTGSSRQRILEYLKRAGVASVADLSHALDLTPVTIRHHLKALLQDGQVAEPRARRKPGPGRPEMVYCVTAKADEYLPRNYTELAQLMLQHLLARRSRHELHHMMQSMGKGMGERARDYSPKAKRMPIERLCAFLELRGYFPAFERGPEGIHLWLKNCPYLETAREIPQLCQVDLVMVQTALDAEVALESWIARGDAVCTLLIRPDP